MMEYICRSPEERKRLHILLLPRETPPSSELIYLKGGYSSEVFPEWHEQRKDATREMKLKCLVNNVVMSSLQNWWFDFRDIQLVRLKGMREFAISTGFKLDFGTFAKILDVYREKGRRVLKEVWHRGAVLILKRFKYLKKRGQLREKWTYCGPFEGTKADQLTERLQIDPEHLYLPSKRPKSKDPVIGYLKRTRLVNSQNEKMGGLSFDDMIDDLQNDGFELQDLLDI